MHVQLDHDYRFIQVLICTSNSFHSLHTYQVIKRSLLVSYARLFNREKAPLAEQQKWDGWSIRLSGKKIIKVFPFGLKPNMRNSKALVSEVPGL